MTLRFKRTSSPGHEPKVDASKLKEVVEIRNGNVNHLELTRDFEYKGVIMFSLKVAKQTLSPGSQKTNQVLEENVLVWGEDTSSIIMNQMIGLRLVDRFNVRFPVAFKGTDLKSGHLWEDVLYCDAFKLMCAPHPISRISLHKDDIAKARLAYAQDLLLKFQTEIDDSIKRFIDSKAELLSSVPVQAATESKENHHKGPSKLSLKGVKTSEESSAPKKRTNAGVEPHEEVGVSAKSKRSKTSSSVQASTLTNPTAPGSSKPNIPTVSPSVRAFADGQERPSLGVKKSLPPIQQSQSTSRPATKILPTLRIPKITKADLKSTLFEMHHRKPEAEEEEGN